MELRDATAQNILGASKSSSCLSYWKLMRTEGVLHIHERFEDTSEAMRKYCELWKSST